MRQNPFDTYIEKCEISVIETDTKDTQHVVYSSMRQNSSDTNNKRTMWHMSQRDSTLTTQTIYGLSVKDRVPKNTKDKT